MRNLAFVPVFFLLGAASIAFLRGRIRDWRAPALMAGAVLVSLICAHTQVVLLNLSAYRAEPLAALRFWQGLQAGGGLAGALAYYLCVARWAPAPLSSLGDRVAPTIWLAIAACRGNCFFDECCNGVRVAYIVVSLALAGLSLRMVHHRLWDGEVILCSTLVYAIFSLLIEPFRDPMSPAIFSISAVTLLGTGWVYSWFDKNSIARRA